MIYHGMFANHQYQQFMQENIEFDEGSWMNDLRES